MMAQNTSHAVMAQRIEPHDSLDDFPTPPWATRALCEELFGRGWAIKEMSVWEPCCNRGYMARPLKEYFDDVCATDIHDYGYGKSGIDFLLCGGDEPLVDLIVANPPFRLASAFIATAMEVSRCSAFLVRTSFLESVTRYATLFADTPPKLILQFVERVPMVKGRYDPRASTATSYCWLIFDSSWGTQGTFFDWIPPCRKRLERPEDVEAA